MKHGILSLIVLILSVSYVSSPSHAQMDDCEPSERPEQEELFTLDYVQTLVGFSHPRLSDIVNMPADPLSDTYVFAISCTHYADSQYVILAHLIDDRSLNLQLLAYQVKDGQTMAFWRRIVPTLWTPHTVSVSRMADRNFNGLPDFYAIGSDGSSHQRYNGIKIFELQPDGTIMETTPVEAPNGFDDINGDGIPEIYDAIFYFPATYDTTTATVHRKDVWWAWNGSEYEMLAVAVQGFEDPSPTNPYGYHDFDSGYRIRTYLDESTQESVCNEVAVEYLSNWGGIAWYLYHVLLYYQTWGDESEGWTQIDPILSMAAMCADSESKTTFFEIIDAFREGE